MHSEIGGNPGWCRVRASASRPPQLQGARQCLRPLGARQCLRPLGARQRLRPPRWGSTSLLPMPSAPMGPLAAGLLLQPPTAPSTSRHQARPPPTTSRTGTAAARRAAAAPLPPSSGVASPPPGASALVILLPSAAVAASVNNAKGNRRVACRSRVCLDPLRLRQNGYGCGRQMMMTTDTAR